jgi:hypothetical protein
MRYMIELVGGRVFKYSKKASLKILPVQGSDTTMYARKTCRGRQKKERTTFLTLFRFYCCSKIKP